ncbi:MAG: AMIN domain-containing protein [Synechococcales cyanobacterium T60_A2020_003]|nr:AMIN domain-containing protein [Synechococcales cyanobacterium T60_A2020_003]
MLVLATQPVFADSALVTGVAVNQTDAGFTLMLETDASDRPQVFTVVQGNSTVSDLVNTQLQLPDGNGFIQENPAPGISSISVTPLDENSVRVTVTGTDSAPPAQVNESESGLVLSFGEVADAGTSTAVSVTLDEMEIAQNAVPIPVQPVPAAPTAPAPQQGQSPTPQSSIAQLTSQDVLVPNPEIYIDGVPAINSNTVYAPPLQSRAVPPPLGDISVSTFDSALDEIDLNTSEVVPRLVLRDAPVRDVLSLLARAAGYNVAYTDEQTDTQASGQQEPQEVRVSLDIENEPVQNVFNYVLRIAGLEANLVGRTVFVGPRLPDDARNVIARTLRLNQAIATDAANFLATQGAEARVLFEQTTLATLGDGQAAQLVEVAEPPEIIAVDVPPGNGPLLLAGLSVTTDPRLNSITLVGSPRKVQIAMDLLSQLDLRQRQVAVNVKVVDVNLLATEDFNTSFSFGVDDGFFVSDGGAATFVYGEAQPPSITDVQRSPFNPPITPNIYPEASDGFTGVELAPFLDAQPDAPFGQGTPQPFGTPPFNQITGDEQTGTLIPYTDPRLNDGTIQSFAVPVFDNNGNIVGFQTQPGIALRGPFGTDENPLQPGVTSIQGGQVEYGLPSLFQYPSDFLFQLETQVRNGSAKILTDPTLTVQEGQQATVALTQEVFGGIERDIFLERPIIKQAGLTLGIVINRIDDNGFVTMQVNPTVTSIGGTATGPASQGTITLLQTRSLESGQIRLRDGQTLILAGIIQDQDRVDISKVPILGDIPILGALFRSTNRTNERREVVVVVTPQVIDDSDLSNFGYRYTPGRDVREILQQQGVPLQ